MMVKAKKAAAQARVARIASLEALAINKLIKKTPRRRRTVGKALRAPGDGGRTRSNRRAFKDIFGDEATVVSNVGHLPAAFANIVGNSTWMKMEGKVTHPLEGDGIAICGCQPFSDIATTNANSNLLTNSTLATVAPNAAQISTDTLNGPLAAQANLHQKYVFTDILIEYVSNVATSQGGSMAMAIQVDGSGVAAAGSFSQTRQVVPSITFPFRTDRAFLHYHYDGPETFWTLLDSTSSASQRQTVQLYLSAYPSASSIGTVSQGFTNVWYRCELYQSVASQGFTLQVETTEEREVLRAIAKRLFPKNKPDKPRDALKNWDAIAVSMLEDAGYDCDLRSDTGSKRDRRD